jgi:signal transduction histidine kinase/ActR/RegA family two-component response regulator
LKNADGFSYNRIQAELGRKFDLATRTTVDMNLKIQSPLLKTFIAASLPMPLLHAALCFLGRHFQIRMPLMGLLMATATLLSLAFGIWLLHRKEGGKGQGARPHAEPNAPTESESLQERMINLERQLFQSQKMEAIGTLASGIAHDFNNILTAIMGYVELAKLDAEPRSKVRLDLEQALNAAHRAQELIRQILSFSRKADEQNRPLDLKALIKETLKLLRASIPATIEIQQHLDGDGALVLANATQLHQVLMNLCTNARQAMGDHGGTLTVRLDKRILIGASATGMGVSPGRYLELTVTDTGPGIQPELREHIFDPYFTTKAEGQGTGLGLAVARSIVQNYGGTIHLIDSADRGASFRVLLPATTAVPEYDHQEEDDWPGGSESILFLDDEPSIASWGQQILARLGYDVASFNRSEEALKAFRKAPHRFDLVVTDVVMPYMTGDLLASQILSIRPDIPVIMFTGYSEKTMCENGIHEGVRAILTKPLAAAELTRAIRRVLDGPPPESAMGF